MPIIAKYISNGGRDYQLMRRYIRYLNRYNLKLFTYSDGTFIVADFDKKLTEYINLRQLGLIVKRLRRYRRNHNLRQMHKNIYKLIEEALGRDRKGRNKK